jgi:hypothetical protein
MNEPVDMSPRAIAQRLDKMRALFDLMRYLAQYRPVVEEAERARKPDGR